MTDDWTLMTAATAIAFTVLLFARAALHKVWDFTAFTGYVADYQLVPQPLARPASLGLVTAEFVTIAALLAPGSTGFGAVLGAALLLLYAGAMAINLHRGRHRIECGCGGAVQPLGWSLVGRNLALAGVSLAGSAAEHMALSAAETATAIAAGFTLWVGYVLVDQVLANSAFVRPRP